MFGLLGIAFIGALIVGGIRKYIFRIKDPDAEELWKDLEQQDWFQELLKDEKAKRFIEQSRKTGILADGEYIESLLSNEVTRNGFIAYLKDRR